MILTHGGNSISRGGTPLPNKCICVDYFTEGYRFGVQMEDDNITSVTPTAISNLDYQSIFPNGIPVALFKNKNLTKSYYSFGSLVDASVGYSIEFWMHSSDSSSSYYTPFYVYCKDRHDYNPIWSYQSSRGADYLDTSGNLIWGHTLLDGSHNGWKHYAITRTGNTLQGFVNGQKSTRPTVYDFNESSTNILLYLYPSFMDVNRWTSLTAGYNMTQLAIWNYPRYTDNFTPSTKLIIDPTYT